MAVRSVESWKRLFRPMAAQPMPEIAERILGDLTHYLHGRSCEDDDRETLGNAILAWKQLGKE